MVVQRVVVPPIIVIKFDKYYTQKKIRIGNSYNDVISKYGKPDKEPALDKGNHRYNKDKSKYSTIRNLGYGGILFMIDKENKVVKSIKVY